MQSTRKNWILALCCLAQFMVVLDVAIVNVALPSIRRDLGFSSVDLQWIVNAYTLTFAGFLLLGGRAADLLGPRRVLIAGLALFAVASLAGGLSTGQAQLVAARALQGLGGAVVLPATLSIITTTFAEGAERNRALGILGCDGRPGRQRGRAPRRRAHGVPRLAVDPLRERPDRDRRGRRRLRAAPAHRARSRRPPPARPRRRHHRDARAGPAHVRDRPHGRQRLGVGADGARRGRRDGAARPLRRHRGPFREAPAGAAAASSARAR